MLDDLVGLAAQLTQEVTDHTSAETFQSLASSSWARIAHGTATPEARICAFLPSVAGPSAYWYMPASRPWTSRFSGSAGW